MLGMQSFGPRQAKAAVKIPLKHKPQPELWSDSTITAAWLGHSTILLNIYGTIILTDPVLSEKIGIRVLGTTVGIERMTSPGLSLEEIPKPHLILLSHAHMDHCDYSTLESFTEAYPNQIDCICAYNTQDVVEDLAWKSLTVMDWKQQHTIGDVHITAQEVRHFGWRFPWEADRRRGYYAKGRSYNAYLLQSRGKNIVFGGDTAMTNAFCQLSHLQVDLAFMPVGAYNPWIQNHCNPEEAVEMAMQMNTRVIAPMHCMTFKQSNEPFAEPMLRFLAETKKHRIPTAWKFIGETYTVE